ncbi:SctN family type III secretion system ATPase BsaS [Burkholderia thailandensis]|uniref:SctN family type III secretion system ATPase BsaS n=1 Tax=Burkholderia thailandensis TaxID=57975 RepID=UPI0003EC8786|nr:SctN family type III secretion system ATPase BsaS [Burkholderia thailandensis]AHI67727.1 putative ATP synthase SpaL [Burkholderia thailandensis H0587]AOJ53458.1 ATP synthase [Burkholderia thailandensis]AVR28415.1 FliI/YscN family ATPase [Burkholderia thailandensis]MCZ2901867.1 SctN family type III secretion system ATPase BsaS [Burkholderia thailandensis]MDD1480377.1 FliI/YscN family ATPase [Burkholderia thailandensis]
MKATGDPLRLLARRAHPRRIQGPIIEAPLPDVAIGELCAIRAAAGSDTTIGRAQVVGFGRDTAILSTLGSTAGLSRQVALVPTGERMTIDVSPALLGAVVDATGGVVETLGTAGALRGAAPRRSAIDAAPPDYAARRPIERRLATGVRAIDGLLTCGVGQRFGIFAAAGCGKTSLMNMMIEHAAADVYVVALIGERGREVSEFVERMRRSGSRDRTVVVYATSDRSSVDRCNAALVATTIAEYFRDLGRDVMLFLDSMTRYARALRDLALAAGEAPARRGYPASVFEQLPRLLERPGRTHAGSITAFYTVLLENEEEPDPIGDEIRSIVDGHVYLSRQLGAKGHFPAIDVLNSASRLFDEIADAPHRSLAKRFRQHLARIDEMQVFLDLGEYRRGENPENDDALDRRPALDAFLKQEIDEASAFGDTLERMREAAS